MTETTLWWIATGAAIALELLSGTFYLLMLSLGLASAALAAHFGASLTAQLAVAAIVGGGAVVACYLFRKKTTAASNLGTMDQPTHSMRKTGSYFLSCSGTCSDKGSSRSG